MKFTPDTNIQTVAEAYALDARDFLQANFKISLDWSDASIEHIERVLEIFHREIGSAKPSEDQVMGFAKMFGSYVGEVYRRRHGGSWGVAEMDGQQVAAFQSSTGILFWPWGKTRDRLVDGAENNVWHYYCALVR